MVGTSAPLTAIPAYLRARDPTTSPAPPPSEPDPPLTPLTDDLHSLHAVRAPPDDSGTPTDLGARMEESAQNHELPRVRDGHGMQVDGGYVPTSDPEVIAVQGSRHGLHVSSPAEACTMEALLKRALVMFTSGVGGPWSSGLGIASCGST